MMEASSWCWSKSKLIVPKWPCLYSVKATQTDVARCNVKGLSDPVSLRF